MAIPIKTGYHFLVQHITKPASTVMPSYDIYEDYYGLGYIVHGDRQISTPDRTFFVHDGYISPINIHMYHRTSPLSDKAYEIYAVRFTPAMAERLIKAFGPAKFDDIMSHASYRLPKHAQADVISAFEQMLEEYEHYDPVSELAIQGLLEKTILILYRYGEISETSEIHIDTKDKAILDVLTYIDLHFMDNPSIGELAAIAGLSESHFMKRFSNSTGCSCKTYIRHYKHKIAQNLLVHTDKSIQEISDELGFCNSNYFCTTFKNISGMNPKKFRTFYTHKGPPL